MLHHHPALTRPKVQLNGNSYLWRGEETGLCMKNEPTFPTVCLAGETPQGRTKILWVVDEVNNRCGWIL